MKNRLIDILENTHLPIMRGKDTIGVYKLSHIVAERIADELITHGIKVPMFKVGDIVWVYDPMWGILPCEVDRPYHCRCGEEGGCTLEMNIDERDIGRYIFHTKEAAEEVWRK